MASWSLQAFKTEKVLTALILIDWIGGTFPVFSPLVPATNHQFRYVSWTFILWLFVFTSDWIVFFDVSRVQGFRYYDSLQATGTGAFADTISSAVVWYTEQTSPAVIRLNFLYYCSTLIQVLKALIPAESRLFNLQQQLKSTDTKKLNLSSWVIFLVLINAIASWNMLLQASGFDKLFTPETSSKYFFLTSNSGFNAGIAKFLYILPQTSYFFAMGIFVVLGVRICNAFCAGGKVVQDLWQGGGVEVSKMTPSEAVMELKEILQQLEFCYQSFRDMIGLPAFVLTFNTILNFAALLHGGRSEGIVFAVTGVLACFLEVFLFATLGYLMEEMVMDVQASLRRQLAFYPGSGDKVELQLKPIADWFVTFQWKLSAKGLYPLGHDAIILLLTLGLTCVIFIFQLSSSS